MKNLKMIQAVLVIAISLLASLSRAELQQFPGDGSGGGGANMASSTVNAPGFYCTTCGKWIYPNGLNGRNTNATAGAKGGSSNGDDSAQH